MSYKYFKRLKIYKNARGTFIYDPEKVEARSYRWWVFVKKINGKVVFNDYSYSVTTRSHQSSAKYLLRELKINVDLYIDMRESMEYFNMETLDTKVTDDLIYKIKGKIEHHNRKRIRRTTKAYLIKDIAHLLRQLQNTKIICNKSQFTLDDAANLCKEDPRIIAANGVEILNYALLQATFQ